MYAPSSFVLFSTLVAAAFAQDTSIVNPTTAAPSATALAASNGYSYVGCYNETVGIPNTDGARALTGGMNVCRKRHIVVCIALIPEVVCEQYHDRLVLPEILPGRVHAVRRP